MIQILGYPVERQAIESKIAPDGLERSILKTLSESTKTYNFDSVEQLRFELKMRTATVNAAAALDAGGMDFAIFRKTKCNDHYWRRTDDGGFILKRDVKPGEAIRDIFDNGRQYATECATAIVIVFYKATLDMMSDAVFNRAFPEITLMNWHSVDPAFVGAGVMRPAADILPGDRQYFANPDVNPEKPEWQGENVIVMGDGSYYGHGLGIHNEKDIIDQLNQNRKKGAEESAYLMKTAGHPNYRKLRELMERQGP